MFQAPAPASHEVCACVTHVYVYSGIIVNLYFMFAFSCILARAQHCIAMMDGGQSHVVVVVVTSFHRSARQMHAHLATVSCMKYMGTRFGEAKRTRVHPAMQHVAHM